jgi:hypothetical protein
MEGWLLASGARFKPLRMTLPGSRSLPDGRPMGIAGRSFPSGLMTARSAVQTICKIDETVFLAEPIASTGGQERPHSPPSLQRRMSAGAFA